MSDTSRSSKHIVDINVSFDERDVSFTLYISIDFGFCATLYKDITYKESSDPWSL